MLVLDGQNNSNWVNLEDINDNVIPQLTCKNELTHSTKYSPTANPSPFLNYILKVSPDLI